MAVVSSIRKCKVARLAAVSLIRKGKVAGLAVEAVEQLGVSKNSQKFARPWSGVSDPHLTEH